MKIAVVTGTLGVRAMKQCVALKEAGHELYLIAAFDKYGIADMFTAHMTFSYQWDSTINAPLLCDARLKGAVDLIQPDVWLVHNEPMRLPEMVRALVGDATMVVDVHDLNLNRNGEPTEEERRMCEVADVLMYVSPGMQESANNAYSVDKPNVVVHSFVPKAFHVDTTLKADFDNVIIYQGQAWHPGMIRARKDINFKYRDFTETIYAFQEAGIPLDMFIPQGISNTYYKVMAGNTNVRVFDAIPYGVLLNHMSRCAWALCTFPDAPQIKIAAPNKLFDAVAAGTPPIVNEGTYMAEWVEKYGVGMTCEPETAPTLSAAKRQECKKNILAKRNNLCMDEELKKLYELV